VTNNERLESMVIFKTMFFSILLRAIGRILLITQEGVDELKKNLQEKDAQRIQFWYRSGSGSGFRNFKQFLPRWA